jgi:hypothetical protein
VARTRAWFVPQGFYRAEIEGEHGRNFSWTTGSAAIVVHEIDRSRPYRVTFHISPGRGPELPPPPHVVFRVDGQPRLRTEIVREPKNYDLDVPVSTGHTLAVGLELSDTFTPGPSDTRALGVQVDNVAIEAVNGFHPTPRVVMLAALAAAAAAATFLLTGFTIGWTVLATLGVAGINTWLLCHDAAFLGDFPHRLAWITVGPLAVASVIGFLSWEGEPVPLVPEWAPALGLALVAAGLKIAFVAHPQAAIDDSLFQVHRAQDVWAGHYFFTSITPRPFFEFPYAIALYVNAMPFRRWFPGELDRVLLLRVVTIVADALVGAAMYFPLRRATGNRITALLFAGLWPFARLPFGAISTGNLTNVYGQGVFGAGMAVVLWMAAGLATAGGLISAGVLLTIGFLSHFSTISVGIPIVGLVAVLILIAARGEHRALGGALLGVLVVASAVSYVAYYRHFPDVYRRTIQRVAAREGESATRSMVEPAPVKAERWSSDVVTAFGVPILLLACAGAVMVGRQPRSGTTLVLGGWLGAWIIFSALGIFTAIDMRSNLAAAPLMLALAVIPLGALARRAYWGAALTTAIALFLAWDGLQLWMACLTG